MWKAVVLLVAGMTLLGALHLLKNPAADVWLRLAVSLGGALTVLTFRHAWKPRKSSTSHGSAAFAGKEEIVDVRFSPSRPLPCGSVLLGKLNDDLIALTPPYTTQHGLICGGSGTGKSFSFFLPNMGFSQKISYVATDPKYELWRYTSGYHRAVRYAPTEPEMSSHFNWIPLCRDARMASLCARAIVESGATHRQEAPWPDLETAFLAALFSHASTLPVPTPLTAYRLLCWSDPAKLVAMFLTSSSLVAREQAVIFQQTHERMRGSITPVLAAKMQWMRETGVARFTSASLAAPDFGKLRVLPEALYWCVPEPDVPLLRSLSALFFTVLLEQIAGEKVTSSHSIPVHLFLDEFANLGVIPNYATTISLARGRGLCLWHGLQSLSQLDACYGKANAQTILTNCATKVALHGLDIETADYFSRTLGEQTALVSRRTWSKKRFALFSTNVSDTTHEHTRMLHTPDEVRRLPENKMLVISGNRRPLLLDKIRYAQPPRTASVPPLGEALALPLEMPTAEAAASAVPLSPPPFPDELKEESKRLQKPRKPRKFASTTVIPKPRG